MKQIKTTIEPFVNRYTTILEYSFFDKTNTRYSYCKYFCYLVDEYNCKV